MIVKALGGKIYVSDTQVQRSSAVQLIIFSPLQFVSAKHIHRTIFIIQISQVCKYYMNLLKKKKMYNEYLLPHGFVDLSLHKTPLQKLWRLSHLTVIIFMTTLS